MKIEIEGVGGGGRGEGEGEEVKSEGKNYEQFCLLKTSVTH
jgi:hypothetical protein